MRGRSRRENGKIWFKDRYEKKVLNFMRSALEKGGSKLSGGYSFSRLSSLLLGMELRSTCLELASQLSGKLGSAWRLQIRR